MKERQSDRHFSLPGKYGHGEKARFMLNFRWQIFTLPGTTSYGDPPTNLFCFRSGNTHFYWLRFFMLGFSRKKGFRWCGFWRSRPLTMLSWKHVSSNYWKAAFQSSDLAIYNANCCTDYMAPFDLAAWWSDIRQRPWLANSAWDGIPRVTQYFSNNISFCIILRLSRY